MGVLGIDIFIECLQMLEVCLRSYCCRSVFDICMVHLVSSWCVEMILHGMWRWFFFMVCGDGCILRTYGFLGKGVVYPWCEDGFIFMSWYTLDMHLEL